MQTSVRELKASLSRVLKEVQSGARVTVKVHDKPVAQIVPIPERRTVAHLATEPGIAWNGRKPLGVSRAEALPREVSLAQMVGEERR